MSRTVGTNNHGEIDYRAHFHRLGLSRASLDAAVAMALERLNRVLGQKVRREVEKMINSRRGSGHG